MQFNSSVIQHHTEGRVPLYDLKRMVKISPDHLAEKSSWFMVDGKLQYFKERDQIRMFSEIFCEEYGKKLGFRMADYQLEYLREITFGTKVGETKFGLLSPNYQDNRYNYYLVSDLLNSDISNLGCYGNYSLSNLISFLRTEYGDVPGVNEAIRDTINLFLFDYVTNQEDRNPKNICYEVEAEAGDDKKYWGLHGRKVKKIALATVFDSERSLGIKKTANGYEMINDSPEWESALPYSSETDNEIIDGMNSGVMELYMDEPEIVTPLMSRLAYGDDFEKLIKDSFSHSNDKVCLSKDEKDFLLHNFFERQNGLRRVLSL